MKTALVGYTGFVGSNLASSFPFDSLYNSKNIESAYGEKPDLLVYSGVRAEKFLANSSPQKDKESMDEAMENIKRISPEKLVLISTIDVYGTAESVDELTPINPSFLQPYGANRYYLECCISQQYKNALIVRLPGLFGENIKKNFIYDYIHRIPSMLSAHKMNELMSGYPQLSQFYLLQENGFYKCRQVNAEEKEMLKAVFEKSGFSALNFTDSRGRYQFYNLNYLWKDIKRALELSVPLMNLAAEPVSISEIYEHLSGMNFQNFITSEVPSYNFKSIYAEKMGGKDGYLYTKQQTLKEISEFVIKETKKV